MYICVIPSVKCVSPRSLKFKRWDKQHRKTSTFCSDFNYRNLVFKFCSWVMAWSAHVDGLGCCRQSRSFYGPNCTQLAALQLESSFLLQSSVAGPEKSSREGLQLELQLRHSYHTHVQLCSHAQLIMWSTPVLTWLLIALLCKQCCACMHSRLDIWYSNAQYYWSNALAVLVCE